MIKPRSKKPSVKDKKSAALSFKRNSTWLLLIPLVIYITYRQVTSFELVSWDDQLYVKDTPMVLGLTWEHVKSMFSQKVLLSYNPLVLVSFAVDYELSHLEPGWSHLVNLLFHMLNALLVYACLKKLEIKSEISGIIALLFAIHPLSVEAVVWVAGRKDMLYGFFFLSAWFFYLHYYQSKKNYSYIISLLLFLLSLLSKVQAITLPFILIISDYILSGDFKWKNIFNKIPFIILSLIFGLIAILGSNLVADKYQPIPTFADKISYSIMGVGLYVFKILFPISQNAIHTFPEYGTISYWQLFITGIAIIIFLFWVIKKSYKKSPLVAGGILFFLISIFVVLHIVAFNSSLIYERFTYIASIGIFISLLHLDQLIPSLYKYKFKIAIPVIFIFSIACFARAQVWKNPITFWSDVIEGNPTSAVGWNNRGMVYYDRGNYENALSDFNECISVQPKHPDAYNNRSIIYFHNKDYIKALADNSRLLAIDSSHKEGYANRGSYFFTMQQYDSAKYYYNKAIKLNPKNASAWFFGGVADFHLKDYESSKQQLYEAISIVPNYTDAYVFLGMCYVRLGEKDSVLACLKRAESFSESTTPRTSVCKEYQLAGSDRFNSGKWEEALKDYNTALELNPNDADALYYVGGVYLSRQNVQQAREYWRKSLAINPEQKDAKEWLAKIGP